MIEKEKHIGEAKMTEQPNKPLSFHIKDKAVTLSKLADEVFTSINTLIRQGQEEFYERAKAYTDAKSDDLIRMFEGQLQQLDNTLSNKISLLDECCTQEKREIQLLKDKYVILANDITANRQSIASLYIQYQDVLSSIASIEKDIEEIKKRLPDVDPPFDINYFYIGSGDNYEDIADEKYAHPFTGSFTGTYNVAIEKNGQRLYVVIPKNQRSKIMKIDIIGREVAGITMSTFDIPFMEWNLGDFLILSSLNTYVAGEYDIEIK